VKRLTIGLAACTETLARLITMAWADGRLEDTEKAGVRAASDVLNLDKELRARLDALLENPLPVDQLLLEELSPRDGAFAFVAAAWLSAVDGKVDPKEQALLEQAAAALQLSPARRAELEALGRELAAHHGAGDWSRELVTLFRAIPARLEAPGEYDVQFE